MRKNPATGEKRRDAPQGVVLRLAGAGRSADLTFSRSMWSIVMGFRRQDKIGERERIFT